METFGYLFFAVASAQGIFFSLVQFFGKFNPREPSIILAWIILCFSLGLIESALWLSNNMSSFVHFVSVAVPLPFIYGPLIQFYFKKSFNQPVSLREYAIHFFPFLLSLLYCSQFYFQSSASKLDMMKGIIDYQDLFAVYISTKYIVLLQAISLFYYSISNYQKFRNEFTLTKWIRNWFMLTNGVLFVYTINFLLFHSLSYLRIIGGCSDYGISFSSALFIYLFSWLAIARTKIFDGFPVGKSLAQPLQKYKNSTLTKGASMELYQKLAELMEHEKPFRDPEIDLDRLADKLGTTRNSISQVINEHSGMNFYDFINQARIKEAQTLLLKTSSKEKNIIEIAYEVGFNNKVSFNKYFKKATGHTPTSFRKNEKE